MGPPELPGGNRLVRYAVLRSHSSFNGAAGITRRKLALDSNDWTIKALLQWGRRNYPAETQRCAVGVHVSQICASMGPPELPGGNRGQRIHNILENVGFNGAAGITRRKPDQPNLGPSSEKPGFNGAAGITRRKRGSDGPGSHQRTGLQWGRRNYPAETARDDNAPHQPPHQLQWGRRNYPAETCCSGRRATTRPSTCFNGAAGITRRKRLPQLGRRHPLDVLLQWGRRNYPAETHQSAMMEVFNVFGLQWGRRNYPAETVLLDLLRLQFAFPLQWGRRNYPAETHGHARLVCVPDDELQWGRRNYPAETPWRRRGSTCRPGASFNGAAGITRRKRPASKSR